MVICCGKCNRGPSLFHCSEMLKMTVMARPSGFVSKRIQSTRTVMARPSGFVSKLIQSTRTVMAKPSGFVSKRLQSTRTSMVKPDGFAFNYTLAGIPARDSGDREPTPRLSSSLSLSLFLTKFLLGNKYKSIDLQILF